MTLTSGCAPAHLKVVGGSAELADDARVRLFELERVWLDGDAANGLACLQSPGRGTIPVAPEVLLLLGLAQKLSDQRGLLLDGSSPTTPDPRDVAHRSIGPGPSVGALTTPRLDFTTMTVALDAPVPDPWLASLRSWSSGLTVDLVIADLVEGGAWGACVSVGGVVRTFGLAADGGDWTITVLAPDGCTRAIQLRDRALASSTQPMARCGPPRPRSKSAGDPSDITWAAVQASMAWQAKVSADGLVGLVEEAALARLGGETAEAALLYRRDGHLREVCRA